MSNTLNAPTNETTTQPETVTEAIVDAIADAEGVSPLDLEPPLAAAVDPDALEGLVESMGRSPGDEPGHVQFIYSGYTVTVAGGGDVAVQRR